MIDIFSKSFFTYTENSHIYVVYLTTYRDLCYRKLIGGSEPGISAELS